MAERASGPTIPSWLPGQPIQLGGRTRLIVIGGVGSKSGDARRAFGPMAQFLAREGGYDPTRDVLEGTFHGEDRNQTWYPRPYEALHTRQPLMQSAEAFAGVLDWYRLALPEDTRFCVLGYSMGGVAAFDGTTMAVARDRAGWRGRLQAVITFSSPLRGTSAGAFLGWAPLFTSHQLGQAGRDLDQRWRDPVEGERLERRAAFLRASGAELMTLADPDDAVVRPDEAVLPAQGQPVDDLLIRPTHARPGTHGHGAIVDEPMTWERVLDVIGPQERGSTVASSTPPADELNDEIRAIKDRLRREGRLRS
jgi:hypothetical protein